MARFDVRPTPLDGLLVLERHPAGDGRGYLERLYCAAELAPWLGNRAIVQVNRTLTASRGTVRGMHYQRPPHAELKIISCLRGQVYDVVLDVRSGSPTFLQWHAEQLSGDRHTSLIIPEGMAHGFQTLSSGCEMLYFHTSAYAPQAEGALNVHDPRLGIDWPEKVTAISDRDRSHPLIDSGFGGVSI